jgi:uncharacterized protein YjbJ (UPF0337 family)
MWNWIKKAWAVGKKVLGKVKGGLDKGLTLYKKGKDLYTDVKGKAASLPVVGSVASDLIRQAEGKVGQIYAEKTGRDLLQDVGRAEGLADKAQRGLGVAEGIVRRAERMESRLVA